MELLCHYCGKVTSGFILWADGRASLKCCRGCYPIGKKDLEKRNGKWAWVVGWKSAPNSAIITI